MIKEFFPTLKRSPPSYIKSNGTDSSLHPPSPMKIWSSSINLNEFVHDLHWCNWSKSGPAIWTAVPMATGSRFGSITTRQKVCLALKGGTPAFGFQPWDEYLGYIWSTSPGLYFWLPMNPWENCLPLLRFPSSKIGIVLHRSVLKIDSAS